jgi:hypothetical protein
LESIRQITVDYKRSRALVMVAPLLPPDLLREALTIAMNIADPFDQVSACIPLAQNLPPTERPAVISKIWSLIKLIENGYDQASALAAIAPFLPPDQHGDLAQACVMVIGSIMDEYDQASAISILAPLLGGESTEHPQPALPSGYSTIREAFITALTVPQQALRAQLLAACTAAWSDSQERTYELWRDIAQRLTSLPLADVLLCLGALMPLIQILGGDEGMTEVVAVLSTR